MVRRTQRPSKLPPTDDAPKPGTTLVATEPATPEVVTTPDVAPAAEQAPGPASVTDNAAATSAAADPAQAPAAPTDDATKPPFGGKGDHDGDGKPGGAAPALAPEPPREKTLAELNAEAWNADAAMAARREEARKAHEQHVAPLLAGTQARRAPRRVQKPVRPPVVE